MLMFPPLVPTFLILGNTLDMMLADMTLQDSGGLGWTMRLINPSKPDNSFSLSCPTLHKVLKPTSNESF